MKFVVDIDGTICTINELGYENAQPIKERIEKLNKLYDSGHTVVYFTARGMGRTNDNEEEARKLFYDMTKKQLELWEVKYHILLLGKPSGDIYIDDKGINADIFFKSDSTIK